MGASGYGVSAEFEFGGLWADRSFKKIERERERGAWAEGIRCGRWEESLALREKQQKRKRENTLAVQCEKKEREGE